MIANDPDSDRLAAAEKIKNSDEWHVFNGNEIALLLSDWAFNNFMNQNKNIDKSKLVMVASTVSSKFLSSMAKHHGFIFDVCGFFFFFCVCVCEKYATHFYVSV